MQSSDRHAGTVPRIERMPREGFQPIDNVSVVLTHMSEVIRNNLPARNLI